MKQQRLQRLLRLRRHLLRQAEFDLQRAHSDLRKTQEARATVTQIAFGSREVRPGVVDADVGDTLVRCARHKEEAGARRLEVQKGVCAQRRMEHAQFEKLMESKTWEKEKQEARNAQKILDDMALSRRMRR